MAGDSVTLVGTGGMASKVKAAKRATLYGVGVAIINGRTENALSRLLDGEELGTYFLPASNRMTARKHWIAFTKSPRGEIFIDGGAEKAILQNGKSLLPSGIKDVQGRFSMGNSVLLLNENKEEVAVGMVNYHSGDIRKIMGSKSAEIEPILGFKHDDEVIHRDNLVLVNQMEKDDESCLL